MAGNGRFAQRKLWPGRSLREQSKSRSSIRSSSFRSQRSPGMFLYGKTREIVRERIATSTSRKEVKMRQRVHYETDSTRRRRRFHR